MTNAVEETSGYTISIKEFAQLFVSLLRRQPKFQSANLQFDEENLAVVGTMATQAAEPKPWIIEVESVFATYCESQTPEGLRYLFGQIRELADSYVTAVQAADSEAEAAALAEAAKPKERKAKKDKTAKAKEEEQAVEIHSGEQAVDVPESEAQNVESNPDEEFDLDDETEVEPVAETEGSKNAETASNQLLIYPSVRALSTFNLQNLKLQTGKKTSLELIYIPFAQQNGVGLVYDKGNGFGHVTNANLRHWQISFKAALDTGLENLRNSSSESWRRLQPGFYVSPWHDTHDSARLLLPEIFKQLEVNGEIIAIAPRASTVFVTGSHDATGLELMLSLSAALMRDRLGIPSLPMKLTDDGGWELFTLAPSDLVAEQLRLFRLNVLQLLYQEQLPILPSLLSDARCAPFLVQRDEKTNVDYSRCLVTENDRFFPLTDCVEFYKMQGQRQVCVARARMFEVMKVLKSDIKQLDNVYPPLFELLKFPNDNELYALGSKPAQTFLQRHVLRGHSLLESMLSVVLPDAALPVGTMHRHEQVIEQQFSSAMSVADMIAFYKHQFGTGLVRQGASELGDQFFQVSSRTAGTSRIATIVAAPSGNGSTLTLTKALNYNCPLLYSAINPQNDEVAPLEQLLRAVLYPGSRLSGALRVIDNSVRQDFAVSDDWRNVLDFYQGQLASLETVVEDRSTDNENPSCRLTDPARGTVVIVSRASDGAHVEVSVELR